MYIRFGRNAVLRGLVSALLSLLLSPSALMGAGFTGPLHDGLTYTMQTKTEADHRWLEARTDTGKVVLRADAKYSGVLWRVHAIDKDSYTFESLGGTAGPRWLAVDATGKVVLQKSDSALATRWKVKAVEGGGDSFSMQNLGVGGSRFLDAKVESQSLALAPDTGGLYPGTNWKFFFQPSMRDAVSHGDIISLKSMSKIEGPRFLEGSTYSGTILLQWTDEARQYSGAQWRMHDNQDGSFSMECLGTYAGKRWLSAKNGQLLLAESTDRGQATRWQITRDESYGVVIRNLDASGNQYLDAYTAAGTAALSADAGVGHSGAHWQVIRHKNADQKVEGRWSSVEALPTVPIHALALPTGKILFWSRYIEDSDIDGSREAIPKGDSNTFLFDPVNASIRTIDSAPVDAFGSGQAYLPDGRILVNGGHIHNFVGHRATQIFDPATSRWQRMADMSFGRWYPSTITLPNGDIFTMSGANTSENDFVFTPEVWSVKNNSWRKLKELRDCNGGSCTLLYPWLHVAPNGKLFASGANQATGYIDPIDSKWSAIGDTDYGFRGSYQGSSVQFEPGKFLIAGGLPATRSAEWIDLNGSTRWAELPLMTTARREPTATLLADGSVFVTGGNEGNNSQDGTAAFSSEIFDPKAMSWTAVDHSRIPRLNHSSSILLADGRVMNMGGGFGAGVIPHKNYQIYSPPYLFKGDRPSILYAPAKISYQQVFKVNVLDGASIAKINLVRLSIDTHAFNFSQGFASLAFSKSGHELSVTAPANGNLASPGPYMLFAIDQNGVPSIASLVILN